LLAILLGDRLSPGQKKLIQRKLKNKKRGKGMKICFMGTPDFACATLQMLIERGYEIPGVFTQPDKPALRGQRPQFSPVKKLALTHHLPLFQPNDLKSIELLLEEIKPDLIVVVAFGKILSAKILKSPPLGCVNVHASLLPKYRGAAPINWAVINGETETGITTILMAERVDSGPIICQEKIPISPQENAGEVYEKLKKLSPQVLLKTIKLIEKREVSLREQKEAEVSFAPSLKKEDGLINWQKSALTLHNLIRGLVPWPGAYTFLKRKRVKIWQADVARLQSEDKAQPGEVLAIKKEKGLVVRTGEGELLLKIVQREGGRKISAYQFALGARIQPGERFS
jgi:methionyl-tRNA formyltransferase